MRTIILLLIVWYTGFSDFNGDGLRTDNEPLVSGSYELHHTYPSGDVEVTTVEQVDPGQWLFITPRDGHSYTLRTLCAVVSNVEAMADETRLYVPMTCAPILWMPLVRR